MTLVCVSSIVCPLWNKNFFRGRRFEGTPLFSEGFRIDEFHRQRVFITDVSVGVEREHKDNSKTQMDNTGKKQCPHCTLAFTGTVHDVFSILL